MKTFVVKSKLFIVDDSGKLILTTPWRDVLKVLGNIKPSIKNAVLTALLSLILTSCGYLPIAIPIAKPCTTAPSQTITVIGATGPQGPKGDTGATGAAGNSGIEYGDTISDIVTDYDIYLEGTGQSPLSSGLSCSLYTVPTSTQSYATATTNSSNFIATWIYTGDFNVPNENVSVGMPVLPTNLQASYQTWYVFSCKGFYIEPTAGQHNWSINSDDGSIVSLDGTEVLKNDGLHSATTVSTLVDVQDGVHTFELDYFGGPPSNQALQFSVDASTETAVNFYH